MPVAKLTFEIDIPHAQSLKDRRQVLRSLKDTLRQRFNVSVAEMDEFPVWNRATVAAVALSRSESYLEGQLRHVEQATQRVLSRFGADLLDCYAETLEGMGMGELSGERANGPAALDGDAMSAMVSLPDESNA